MGKTNLLLAPVAAALLAACAAADAPAEAAEDGPSLVGEYRINAMEQAGGLLLTPDHKFQYAFTTGALDEQAAGRWEFVDGKTCLTTDPKPVPPTFTKGAVTDSDAPTLLVALPNGRGIAGVDFVIGFDSGDPVTGYTQEYGYTLPPDETRAPRWIELHEPIYDISAPRFTLGSADQGKLRVLLTPNDVGTVDFEQACLEPTADGVVLHRREGDMPFRRIAAGE